jgi:hypothetical protein
MAAGMGDKTFAIAISFPSFVNSKSAIPLFFTSTCD